YSFFFSSRRRHTRSKRDWSSDVCSSDLSKRDGALRVSGHQTFPFLTPRWELSPGDLYGTNSPGLTALGDAKGLQVAERHILVARSEERRVGKEPRERWAGSRKQAESLHE